MTVTNTALVGRFLGPSSLGQFRFGWRLVTQATAPAMAANAYTLQPALVRLSDDPARMRHAALSSFRLVSLVAFPLGALFIAFGDTLAVVLFGEAWRNAGPIMVALAGMGIALPMESVASEIFKATGHPEILPRMHAVWAVTSIVLIAALVHLGAVAVAIGWSISTICTAIYALMNVPRILGMRAMSLVNAILPSLVSAVATAVALLLFNRYVLNLHPRDDLNTWGVLLLELCIGAVLYVSANALLAREALRELRHTAGVMIRRREHVVE